MGAVRFEWDDTKNAANRRKHGVSFETAARVFADPFALSEQDRVEAGEKRWRTIGPVEGFLVLVVVHTVREEREDPTIEIIHIVSARKADRRERQRYEEEIR